MTITTEQAIALAREVYGDFSPDELAKKHITQFANLIRKETLLEAAEWFWKNTTVNETAVIDELRRMAVEE